MANYGIDMSLHQSHEKSTLGWLKKNGGKGIITIKKSFNHKQYSHQTTVSSYVWHLKEILDVTRHLKLSVVRCATPYSNISKSVFCVCMKNWLLLVLSKTTKFWTNEWSFSKSHHENKYLLENFNWFNESLFVKPSQKKN